MNRRMYLVFALEYNNGIKTNTINYSICDSLEDAIEKGKNFIKEDIEDNNKILEDYSINILVFSTNRKIFKNPKELIDYFNDNIKNISNTQLYDFLLSLVEYDSRMYNYNGEYINNIIFMRQFLESQPIAYNIEFTEESCMNGIYEFWFRY